MSLADHQHEHVTRLTGPPEITFGLRLRATRKAMGLEMAPMAELLAVGVSTYSAWENDRDTPRDIRAVARRVEKATGVPAAWLLGVAPELDLRDVRLRQVRQALEAAARALEGFDGDGDED